MFRKADRWVPIPVEGAPGPRQQESLRIGVFGVSLQGEEQRRGRSPAKWGEAEPRCRGREGGGGEGWLLCCHVLPPCGLLGVPTPLQPPEPGGAG